MVRSIDENGSLKLVVKGGEPAEVTRRIPVEGVATDRDGVEIHVLLHAPEGVMDELEIYRDDSHPLMHPVRPSAISVVVY